MGIIESIAIFMFEGVHIQNAWKFYPEQEIQLSEIPKLQFRLSHQ